MLACAIPLAMILMLMPALCVFARQVHMMWDVGAPIHACREDAGAHGRLSPCILCATRLSLTLAYDLGTQVLPFKATR